MKLKVEILLPVWRDAVRAPAPVRAAWDSYIGQLKAHEERHKEISVLAAKKRLVHGHAAPGTCADLQARLDRARGEVLAKEDQAQEQLEAE